MGNRIVVSDERIIEAGRSLAAEGRTVNGFSLWRMIKRGDPGRMQSVWDAALQADAPAPDVTPVVVLPQSVADLAGQARESVSARVGELASSLWEAAERIASERVRAEVEAARAQVAELRRVLEEANAAVVEANAEVEAATDRAEDAEAKMATAKAETDAEVERVRGDLRAALDAIGRIQQAA